MRNRHLHAIEQASRRRRRELLIYAQATRDARVARRRLDHRHARLELAPFFSVLDDGHREAVLDGRERVEILALRVDLDAGRRELVADLHDGRVAHERRGVLEQTARAGAARRRRVQRAAAAHEASRRAEGGRERGNHGAEEFHVFGPARGWGGWEAGLSVDPRRADTHAKADNADGFASMLDTRND